MPYRAYDRVTIPWGHSTVLPDMDFETYSEAGFKWDPETSKFTGVSKGKKGIAAVGHLVYAQHPSTEILSLAYDLKDGNGPRLWIPGCPDPKELFDHIARGGLIEAWNCPFEDAIWEYVAYRKMGWPKLPSAQLRDAMIKARCFALPGSLAKASEALETETKLKSGTRLLNKFSCPRNPTKGKPDTRIYPTEDADGPELFRYNIQDIKSEFGASIKCPDLTGTEFNAWSIDQKINQRGVHIDRELLDACIHIVDSATERYTQELMDLTNGAVRTVSEVAAMRGWLSGVGVYANSLDADSVIKLLDSDRLPENARRVLKIRQSLSASSVKKLYTIRNMVAEDGRLHWLLAFYGAERTGRWAGRGPQPQNLPGKGPDLFRCECGRHFGLHCKVCPSCMTVPEDSWVVEWSHDAVEDCVKLILGGSLDNVERIYGDAIAVISGCLRALFCAAPGKEFLCSDYSAIEAVSMAMVSGEKWREDVFRTHGMIYEMSAAKITGIPFEEFLNHKKITGHHHPLRKKVGKIAELSGIYGGGVGARRVFGAEGTDEEIMADVKAWREASPMITQFWYRIYDCAIRAVRNPGRTYAYRGIEYCCRGDVLGAKLLSGRWLYYHKPRLHNDITPWGKQVSKLSYMGYNSNPAMGPVGWVRLNTWSGKLSENLNQGMCRDIISDAIPRLEKLGYSVVLHVHDEIISEVPEGTGSIDTMEMSMESMPFWAADWPIKARGGWRGKRFRKG